MSKLTLPQKEYIFGMLFLKRCSDVFEERRERIIRDNATMPLSGFLHDLGVRREP